jgi:hypothetical protein
MSLQLQDLEGKLPDPQGSSDARISDLSKLTRSVVYLPVRISLAILSKCLYLLRPISPQLVPLVICLLLIPLLVMVSISAGWMVYKTVAVGWQVDVYLQYGCVCLYQSSFLLTSHMIE